MKLGKKISVILMLVLSLCMVCSIFAACDEEKVEPLTFDSFTSATAQVFVGQETTLKVKSNRNPEEGEVIEWKSDKESVATVNNGKVKGVAEGEATITATYGENKATCKVTVQLKKEISLDKDSIVLYVGGTPATLTATCKKGDAVDENATVTWTSSDETVVTVKDGVVTAVASDEAVRNAVITADYDGNKSTCNVKVINDGTDYAVGVGNSNAIIKADPGTWFYFAKTSSNVTNYEGIDIQRTHDANGEILTCHFDKIETLEGKDVNAMELYLRYMSTLPEGTRYQVSFTLTSNIAGKVSIGTTEKEFGVNEAIEFSAIETVTSTPLNIKFIIEGEDVNFVLTNLTITTDFVEESAPEQN